MREKRSVKHWIQRNLQLFVHGLLFICFLPLTGMFAFLGLEDERIFEEAIPAILIVWGGTHLFLALLMPPVLKASGYTKDRRGKLVPPEFEKGTSEEEKDAQMAVNFATSKLGRTYAAIMRFLILAGLIAILALYVFD